MNKGITWVGLDAHKQSISVAMRLPGRRDFIELTVPNEPRAVKRFAKKLVREADGGEVRCCYEAGPCGYALQREMMAAAPVVVEVIAPSLIPRKAGERIKTDRRDARKLCELLEAGLLTEVRPPNEAEEAVRDLTRCRGDLREDLGRARHRLGKWLLRRGMRFTAGKKAWTREHEQWLRGLRFDDPIDQAIIDDYFLAIVQIGERIKTTDTQIEAAAQREPYRDRVRLLRCFRGVDTLTAMGLLSELFDFTRFESPRQLMSYVGITPSEHSSAGKPNRGSITKAGNGHVRRLVIEASHHYRHRPGVGGKLAKRRESQPTWVIGIADKAQQRLHRRYHRLLARSLPTNKVVVALARELLGFLWAAMTDPRVAEAA